MKNKVVVFLAILLIITIVTVFLPVDKINLVTLLGFENNSEYSALEVYSLGGDMKILLDDKEEGIVKESQGKFELSPIKAGRHKVTLERISSTADFMNHSQKNWTSSTGLLL